MPRSTSYSPSCTPIINVREKRPSRSHATRSCVACRRRKTRCRLGNLDVPSSQTPLASRDACERCNKMGLKCVVWDGERRGSRYTLKPDVPSTASSPRRVEEHRPAQPDILSSIYPLPPTFSATPAESPPVRPYHPPTLQGHDRSNSVFVEGQSDIRMLITRRPFYLLILLLDRQGIFSFGLPRRMLSISLDVSSSCDLLDELLRRNHSFPSFQHPAYNNFLSLFVQHPHLAQPEQIVQQYRKGPTPSLMLLLGLIMYLCRISCTKIENDNLLTMIRQYASHLYLRAPRITEAAQALELIAVHLPFIMDDKEINVTSTNFRAEVDNPAPGSTLIHVAANIASALNLDKSEAGSTGHTLWTSLCCWKMALKMHDDEINPEDTSTVSLDRRRNSHVTGLYDVIAALTVVATKALYIRYETIQAMQQTVVALQEARDNINNADQIKARQIELTDDLSKSVERLRDERCILQSENDILNLNSTAECEEAKSLQKTCQDALRCHWLWLDVDSYALQGNILGRALTHVFLHNNRARGRPDSYGGLRLLWTEAEWKEHFGDLGVKRNHTITTLLSKSCTLDTMCTLAIPMPLYCAYLVTSAKALLDTQTVILQSYNRVHSDTLMYVMTIKHLAAQLQQCSDGGAISSFAQEDVEKPNGIAQCSAAILELCADTMVEWQERQALVLARHRLAQANRAADDTAMATDAVSGNSTESTLQQQRHENDDGMHSYSLDDLLSYPIDALFDGIVDMPSTNFASGSRM